MDFIDMENDLLYTAAFLIKKDDNGNDFPFTIITSIIADSGEIGYSRNKGREVVYKPVKLEMKLLVFDSEASKLLYMEQAERGDKERYKK